MFWPSIRRSVNIILCATRSLWTQWSDFHETWHKYSSREWALLKRFSRSDVRGQGHDQTSYSTLAESSIDDEASRRTCFHNVEIFALKNRCANPNTRTRLVVRNECYFWFLPRCSHASAVLTVANLSFRPSVCQTRDLWQNKTNVCPHSYTIWKVDA